MSPLLENTALQTNSTAVENITWPLLFPPAHSLEEAFYEDTLGFLDFQAEHKNRQNKKKVLPKSLTYTEKLAYNLPNRLTKPGFQ